MVMNNLYFIEGKDFLEIEEKINEIIRKCNFVDNDINIHDMSEESLVDAMEDIDTYSFLTPKKVVIIKSIQDATEDGFKHLTKYVDNPSFDVLVIVTTNVKLDERKKITKLLKKKFNYIKVEIDKDKYIKNIFDGYSIDKDCINLLKEYCLDDFSKLDNECNKLKLYKYDEKIITIDDVKDLVIKKTLNKDDLVFSLSKYIASKDKKNALITYKELLNYKIEPFELIGLIASQFRLLLQIKILDQDRLNDFDIAKKLEVNPYRVKKSRELLYLYTKKELMDFIKVLADIDLKSKAGLIESNIIMEMLIINL